MLGTNLLTSIFYEHISFLKCCKDLQIELEKIGGSLCSQVLLIWTLLSSFEVVIDYFFAGGQPQRSRFFLRNSLSKNAINVILVYLSWLFLPDFQVLHLIVFHINNN